METKEPIGTLRCGTRYNTEHLCLFGWTVGDGSGHDGYDCWAYFEADGTYKGPDTHNIEPVFLQHDGAVIASQP